MIDVNITATKLQSMYRIPIYMDSAFFPVKFDTGSRYTVVSVELIREGLSDSHKKKIRLYCENHNAVKEKFISASRDTFEGYLIRAVDVTVGDTTLNEFFYYLVIENKRSIALLGCDFIDGCRYEHEPYGNIIISKFDDEGYFKGIPGNIENAELVSYIEEIL